MIQQVLAMRHIAGCRIGAVGEQGEPILARKARADHDQRFERHMSSRAIIAVGE
jgi:hypothetical protein